MCDCHHSNCCEHRPVIEDDDYFENDKTSYKLDDDMTFPKATIDPKLIKLQKEVTEFVTQVILKHEKEFYTLVRTHFSDQLDDILGTTNKSIIEMITMTTDKFYNKLYSDIQYKKNSDLAKIILEICECADYGPHILLDKLMRLTIDAHLDVNREKLITDSEDLFLKNILEQINIYLLSKNLLHILSKGKDEDTEFVYIPEGKKAFDIVIDKQLGQ